MKNTILSENDSKLIEKALLQHGRIIDIKALMTIFTTYYSTASAHNRIAFLAKAGWLRRLKQGLYLIIDSLSARSQTDISLAFIANALNSDSYVSLSYALNHYQMFDQYSDTIISITDKKNAVYVFDDFTFKFSKVKQNMYFGFSEKIDVGKKIRLADAEKAIIDYLYLSNSFATASLIFEILRDHQQHLDLNKLIDYTLRSGATIQRKIGWLLDSLKINSTKLYQTTHNNRSVSKFTNDSKSFNAKWRLYYDDRIIG